MPPKDIRQARVAARQEGRQARVVQNQTARSAQQAGVQQRRAQQQAAQTARRGAIQSNNNARVVNRGVNQGIRQDARTATSRPVVRQARLQNRASNQQLNRDIRAERFLQEQNRKNFRTEMGRGQEGLRTVGELILPGIAQDINATTGLVGAVGQALDPAAAFVGQLRGGSGGGGYGSRGGGGYTDGGMQEQQAGPPAPSAYAAGAARFTSGAAKIGAALGVASSTVAGVQNMLRKKPSEIVATVFGIDPALVANIIAMSQPQAQPPPSSAETEDYSA